MELNHFKTKKQDYLFIFENNNFKNYHLTLETEEYSDLKLFYPIFVTKIVYNSTNHIRSYKVLFLQVCVD